MSQVTETGFSLLCVANLRLERINDIIAVHGGLETHSRVVHYDPGCMDICRPIVCIAKLCVAQLVELISLFYRCVEDPSPENLKCLYDFLNAVMTTSDIVHNASID